MSDKQEYVQFDVRGQFIKTKKESLLWISYFKDLFGIMSENEIIFIDFDPKAFHEVINYAKMSNYMVPAKYLYIFDNYGIQLNSQNISQKIMEKCIECGNSFIKLSNNKEQKVCKLCICDIVGCQNILSKIDDARYCDLHRCEHVQCVEKSDRQEFSNILGKYHNYIPDRKYTLEIRCEKQKSVGKYCDEHIH